MGLKIKLNSIMVDNQDKALKFYTEVLGFAKGKDIPVGEYRWITVISPEGHPDVELALEPNANPAGKTFQSGALPARHPGHRVRSRRHPGGTRRLKAPRRRVHHAAHAKWAPSPSPCSRTRAAT